MAGSKDIQGLWWPKFESLYEGLREVSVSPSLRATDQLNRLLQASQAWLRQGVQGFKPPTEEARAVLEKESHMFLANGKKLPFMAELRAAAVALSRYLVQ